MGGGLNSHDHMWARWPQVNTTTIGVGLTLQASACIFLVMPVANFPELFGTQLWMPDAIPFLSALALDSN